MYPCPPVGSLSVWGILLALHLAAVGAEGHASATPACARDLATGGGCSEAVVAAAAVPVSPGAAQARVRIATTCATFSWGTAAGAERYELAVFDAWWHESVEYEEQLALGQLLARTEIEASAALLDAVG